MVLIGEALTEGTKPKKAVMVQTAFVCFSPKSSKSNIEFPLFKWAFKYTAPFWGKPKMLNVINETFTKELKLIQS